MRAPFPLGSFPPSKGTTLGGKDGGEEHLRRGVSDKEQRQYEHIGIGQDERPATRGREEEVAARTVMKQQGEEHHKEKGEEPQAGTGVIGVGGDVQRTSHDTRPRLLVRERA